MRTQGMVKALVSFIIMLEAFFIIGCNQDQVFDLPAESQTFGQEVKYNSKVDVLWVIDSSESMQSQQANISNQVDAILDKMVAAKLDFNVGFTNMDMGKNGIGGILQGNPSYLRLDTADLRSLMQQRFNYPVGSSIERGLESMKSVLNPLSQQSSNKGFLRDEALLVVIFLTNEDDESSGLTKDYIDFLDSVKKPFPDGSRSWVAHFIGVTEAVGSCRTLFMYSEPGTRYMDLVAESGGISSTICTADLRVALDNIRRAIIHRLTDFVLDRRPVLASIHVYVNGKEVLQNDENGWSYLTETNSIRFNGSAVPAADASIVIDFKPAEAK